MLMPAPGKPIESVPIPLPDWTPTDSELLVPPILMERVHNFETPWGRHGRIPSTPFIAAAVLDDPLERRPDSEVNRQARQFAAVDEIIATEPGTPVLVADGSSAQAGITAPGTGLAFVNTGAQGVADLKGVVFCDTSVEVELEEEKDAARSNVYTQVGRHFMMFMVPDYVLTWNNLTEAPGIAAKFPEKRIMVAGQAAITRFLRNALDGRAGSQGSARRRLLAGQVVQALAAEKEALRPLPEGNSPADHE